MKTISLQRSCLQSVKSLPASVMVAELADEISASEQLARFLRQSSYVAKLTGRIKYNAFLPAPDHDTSVFRVDRLNFEEIEIIAKENVKERSKNGAAIFAANLVHKAKLEIQSKEPPPRHANIRGWSMNDDPELRRSERNTAAMILSEDSKWMNWAS